MKFVSKFTLAATFVVATIIGVACGLSNIPSIADSGGSDTKVVVLDPNGPIAWQYPPDPCMYTGTGLQKDLPGSEWICTSDSIYTCIMRRPISSNAGELAACKMIQSGTTSVNAANDAYALAAKPCSKNETTP